MEAPRPVASPAGAARRTLLALLLLAMPARVALAGTAEERASSASPHLDLRGFFDVNLGASLARLPGRDSTALETRLGQFDLFMVSRLSDRISFLGELVVESDGASGSRAELERAHIRYAIAEGLQVTAGRTHSPISLWNVAYHHGALLQPTIDRPTPVEFEDGAGLLPLHSVGVELGGRVPAGSAHLAYTATVTNGRGPTHEVVQTAGDDNRDKALGLSASFVREMPWSLRLGGGMLHDRISGAFPGGEALREDIFNLHGSASSAGVDAIAEYFVVRDRGPGDAPAFTQRAWYGVLSFGGGAWHPYAAAEEQRVDTGDPYFAEGVSGTQRGTLGLRFDVNAANVIKLEYRNTLRGGVREHAIAVQTAFAF